MNEVTKTSVSDAHEHLKDETGWRAHWDLLLALVILIILLVLEYGFQIALQHSSSLA